MLIRNLRTPQDLTKAVITQDELLRIAIANDANIANARRAHKLGEPAPLPIEDQRTKEEMIQDESLQIKDAQRNLQDLGFKFDEASAIINALGYGGALIINSSYPSLKKMFLSTYNIKTATPSFFIDWFKQYSDELDASKGLTFGNASKFNALIANLDDLRAVIPTKGQLTAMDVRIGRMGAHLFRTIQSSKGEIMDRIRMMQEAMPTDEQLQRLAENTPENKELLDAILEATSNFPSREQIQSVINTNMESKEGLERVEAMLTGVSDAKKFLTDSHQKKKTFSL